MVMRMVMRGSRVVTAILLVAIVGREMWMTRAMAMRLQVRSSMMQSEERESLLVVEQRSRV